MHRGLHLLPITVWEGVWEFRIWGTSKEGTRHTDVQQRAMHCHPHGMPRALPPCHPSQGDKGEKLNMRINPATAWSCAMLGSSFTKKERK